MTTWISHRGYCERATENTEAAFDHAIELGFSHLETDLRSTRDGHIVLAHDDNLVRISGEDLLISQMTRKELESVRLVHGEPLLFFDRFLEKYSHLDWILDIKADRGDDTLKQLHNWQQDKDTERFLSEHARYLMWDAKHELRLQAQLKEPFCLARAPACYVVGVAALIGLPKLGGIVPNQYYAVPPQLKGLSVLSPALVERYHRHGAGVIGYLPETRAQHEQALAAGVDELLTNHAHLKVEL
ncbi:glycerophosphodiester phosphodiesterase [Aliidiomarina sp. Khilg15.8]